MDQIITLKVRIPLGINSDYRYISKDVIEKALQNSKHVPLIDYREESTGIPIGVAMKDLEFDDDANLLVGEFIIRDKITDKDDLKYGIEFFIVKSHKEERCVIFDEVEISGVAVLND